MTEKQVNRIKSLVASRNINAARKMRAHAQSKDLNYIFAKRFNKEFEDFLISKEAQVLSKSDKFYTVKIDDEIWYAINFSTYGRINNLRPTHLLLDNKFGNIEFNRLFFPYPFVFLKCKKVEFFD